MKITVNYESKPFKEVHDKEVDYTVRHNPCKYCALGIGMSCVSRKDCQWDKEEIFIKCAGIILSSA